MRYILRILRFLRAIPGGLWIALTAAGGAFLIFQRAKHEAAEEARIDAQAKGEKNLVKHLVSQARRAKEAAAAAEKRLTELPPDAPAEEVHEAAHDAERATREAQARGADLRRNLFKTLDLK